MYASSDVNIVMHGDVLRAMLLRQISDFPSGAETHNLLIARETL